MADTFSGQLCGSIFSLFFFIHSFIRSMKNVRNWFLLASCFDWTVAIRNTNLSNELLKIFPDYICTAKQFHVMSQFREKTYQSKVSKNWTSQGRGLLNTGISSRKQISKCWIEMLDVSASGSKKHRCMLGTRSTIPCDPQITRNCSDFK